MLITKERLWGRVLRFEPLERRRMLSVWSDPVDGLFNDATKWDPPQVPDNDDSVTFDETGSYTVDFTAISPTNIGLDVDKGTVTFDLKGQHYRLSDATEIAGADSATLSVQSTGARGSVDSEKVHVGVSLFNQGKLRIEDVNWTTDGEVVVGLIGQGNLELVSGSLLDLQGHDLEIGKTQYGNGTAVVDNATLRSVAPQKVWVGQNEGTGSLTIRNGGVVTHDKAYVGRRAQGVVSVESDASWQHEYLSVGHDTPPFPGQNAEVSIVSGGGVITSGDAVIGMQGGRGTVTVSGTSGAGEPSMWTVGGDLAVAGTHIGEGSANGTLTVRDSAKVSVAGNLFVSEFGAGAVIPGLMKVEQGGEVDANIVHIGVYDDVEGVVFVKGVGSFGAPSKLTTSGLVIGVDGKGVLYVSDGAHVEAANFIQVGAMSGSLLNRMEIAGKSQAGTPSMVETAGLAIGYEGQADVVVSDGGMLKSTATAVMVGSSSGTSTVTVRNGAKWENQGAIWLGASGYAVLTISDAEVTSAGSNLVSTNEGSKGDVYIEDGKWIIALGGSLSVGNDKDPQGSTIIELKGNSLLDAGNELQLNKSVELRGDAKVKGNTIRSEGATILPGDTGLDPTAGKLTLEGNYEIESGTLVIDVGGTTPEDGYDELHVIGSASLDDTLQVVTIDDFEPTIGQEFSVLTIPTTAGNLNDSFDVVDVAQASGSWEVEYDRYDDDQDELFEVILRTVGNITITGFRADGEDMLVDYTISGGSVSGFDIGIYTSSDGAQLDDELMTQTVDDLTEGSHTVSVVADFDDAGEDSYPVAIVDAAYQVETNLLGMLQDLDAEAKAELQRQTTRLNRPCGAFRALSSTDLAC